MIRAERTILLALMSSSALPLLLRPPVPAGQRPASGGTRRPSAIAFSADGGLVYVLEQQTGQVAIVDAATGKTQARIPTGGKEPTGMAAVPGGHALLVANNYSESVGILDVDKRALRASVPVRGGPYSLAVAGNGAAWVSLERLDELAEIDISGARITRRVHAGRRPRALAMAPDGLTLVCANMAGGDVSIVDTAAAREVARVAVGAINLRGIAVDASGGHAYVTGQQPHNDAPTERPEAMWSNVLCVLSLSGASSRLETTITLDSGAKGAADPYSVALTESHAYVALGGTHEVASVDLASQAVTRAQVGANPRAVALDHVGRVWVANHLGNSVAALRPDLSPLRTIGLESPDLSDPRLTGRFMFTSADLTRGSGFTCNTCHPDGNTEGLTWRFAHVNDGIERRNSRNLRGGILLTGPFGWTGRVDDFEEFVNGEVQGLLRGPKLSHSQVHAFWDLVNEMDMPPNPYRNLDGAFTSSALRGRALFSGAAGCVSCHQGEMRGGAGKKMWIGTTPAGVKLDVPHLVGCYDSAPYLHDARAETLESVFAVHDKERLHGKAYLLGEGQVHDLLEYVREL